MFMGGGGPSTEDVIKDGFKEQKDFLVTAFEKQKEFIETQFQETSLKEQVISALSNLETMELKHVFIKDFEQYQPVHLDEIGDAIVGEMDYFEHREVVADLINSFETFCFDE